MVLVYPCDKYRTAPDAVTWRTSRATTRRGAASPRVEFFGYQKFAQRRRKLTDRSQTKVLQFATWNVRSLVNAHGSVETSSVRSFSRGVSELATVQDDRKIDIVVGEFRRLGIEVAGLQESYWFGQEAYVVEDAIVLSSGRPVPPKEGPFRRGEGVAIVLRGRARRAWEFGGSQWKAVSSRIVMAKFPLSCSNSSSLTNKSIVVVSCYAPTFRSSRTEKDKFFNELQNVLDGVGRHDKMVLLGDFNARVGSRGDAAYAFGGVDLQAEWSHVRGPDGIGECNDAGKELLSFMSINDASICNTWFKKRAIYKQSWQHPCTRKWHSIDFIVVHQRDRLLCQDCRVIVSAHCGSDHRLVCMDFKLPHMKFPRRPGPSRPPRFDISRLHYSPDMSEECKSAVLERTKQYQSTISSRLRQDEELDLEGSWNKLRDSLVEASREHLGYSRRRQPDWFNERREVIAPLLLERCRSYNQWTASGLAGDHAEFKKARSKVRTEIRKAKNEWLESVVEQAEGGRISRRSGSMWSAIHNIRRNFRGLCPVNVSSVRNEDGVLCQTVEAQRQRWQRHFEQLLNIESNFDLSVFDSLPSRPVNNDLGELPTMEELTRAVTQLSNGKAAGCSGILPEMVKCAGPDFATALLDIIHKAWREGCVPKEWRNAELVPIPKKGNLTSCDNWRGIALLDVVGKVVGRLIQTRLQQLAERELPESQCGFRRGRSCTDQIFTVSQIVEKLFEHRTPGHLVFIDLKKAYDSVPRKALWRALEVLGAPPQLIRMVQAFHEDMTAAVRFSGAVSSSFPVHNGLRQGCSMAPVLFNLFLALVVEKWHMEKEQSGCGVDFNFNINGNLFNRPRAKHQQNSVSNLEFADDAVLFALSRIGAQSSLTTFHAVASSFGLSVNFMKTKAMACGAGHSDDDLQPLTVAGETVESVSAYGYLGSLVSPSTRAGLEVDRRLAAASRAFGALRKVLCNSSFSFKTKRMLYSACVLSVLLYGAECWPLLKRDESRLNAFHHRCLRAMLHTSRWNQQWTHVSNLDLRKRWGDVGLVSDMVRSKRLEWLGHVARMSEDRLPKKMLFGWLPHSRPAHGPRLRWRDCVQADLRKLEADNNWFELTANRQDWRRMHRTLPEDMSTVPCQDWSCEVCKRTFKSKAGIARHKCVAERKLPVHLQAGAKRCLVCERWFKSAGGLAVHKCTSPTEPITTLREPSGGQESFTMDSMRNCCNFHCGQCQRCFKSKPGFNRHNCQRGRSRPVSSDRGTFQVVCNKCERRFRFHRDLQRHKCKSCSSTC